MKKLILLGFFVCSLTACDSAHKRQFMEGCTQGFYDVAEDICECTYDKIENHYGEESIEIMAKTGYMPDDFMDKTIEFGLICKAGFE